MRFTKTTTLELASHLVTPDFDGFGVMPDETDGARILGVADLLPDEAYRRRGRWVITVEFDDVQGLVN